MILKSYTFKSRRILLMQKIGNVEMTFWIHEKKRYLNLMNKFNKKNCFKFMSLFCCFLNFFLEYQNEFIKKFYQFPHQYFLVIHHYSLFIDYLNTSYCRLQTFQKYYHKSISEEIKNISIEMRICTNSGWSLQEFCFGLN